MAPDFKRLQDALPRRYTLVRELDRGGMSRVYLARESLPDRDVAIKVLDEELSARLGRERFVREVEVTSRLSHPHIVPIYAAGDAGGALYYVMPYISGESLRDRLERETQLPVEDALQITHQVADAVHHAHEKGIVHRDIKPANILFHSGHAVVADFGIARALRAAEGGREFTQSGLPLGTPDYMSPEQASGEGPIDGRTDVYALGCVLYEMLAGEPPFHSRSTQVTLARQMADPMPPLKTVRSSVPAEVEHVIARALAKTPADRPADLRSFSAELRAASDVGRPKNSATVEPSTHRSMSRPLRVAGVLTAATALAISIQVFYSAVGANGRYLTGVAVMPFENRTSDPRLQNLGLSLASEVINRLTTVEALKVIDLFTTSSLMKDSLGTPRLLDSLEVDHIIHGYIEQRDEGLVVTVLESDREASLSPSTRHRLDPGRMAVGQVALANTVVSEFLEEVGLGGRFDPSGSVIGPGREAYLAGLSASGRRTPAGMREALDLFRQAIALEPQSAAALAALSSAYALTLYYKYDVGLDGYALAGRALAAADSAIAMDPDVASAYSARGYIRALLGIEIDGAAADFAMAESLAPNQPNGPSWSARILARQGEIEEAFSQARRARDLDPLQAGRRTALASLGFQLGEYDITIDESREALALEAGLTLATAYEGRALALTGRGQECLQLEFGVYELVRALCLQQLGRTADALARVRAVEDRLNAGQSNDPDHLPEVFAQDLASFYGMIGDVEGSVRWLHYAFDLSPAGVDERLLGSELFHPVRNDPRFSEALGSALTRARDRVEQLRAGRLLL